MNLNGSGAYYAFKAVLQQPGGIFEFPPLASPGGNQFSAGDFTLDSAIFEAIVDKTYILDRPAGAEDTLVVLSVAAHSYGEIPTLTEWGVIIMAVLLAGGIVLLMARHRRRLATA